MANNYCQYSVGLSIPKGREMEAKTIALRVSEELEKDEATGFCGTDWSLEDENTENPYIWFYTEESGCPEHVEKIAKAILEEMKLNGPFAVSWSYTCSKPRLDEFGGGAFVAQRGKKTVWVDAASEAMKRAKQRNRK